MIPAAVSTTFAEPPLSEDRAPMELLCLCSRVFDEKGRMAAGSRKIEELRATVMMLVWIPWLAMVGTPITLVRKCISAFNHNELD